MTLRAGGTAYDLSGAEDAPVVVLIHGLGLTRQITWDGMVAGLSAHYRVVHYDLLGHGQTALPMGDVTLTALSDQLIALMDHLEIAQAALVGFSLGGMINRRAALDHPDRVAALAILNSPHEREARAQALYEEAARKSASGGPEATVDAALARWFTEEFQSDNVDVVAHVRQAVMANDAVNYAAHRYVLATGVTELIRPDPGITTPTLIMTCDHDSGSTPAMSHAIASEIPNAQVTILNGLRHLGLVEQPHLFSTAVLAFLDATL